MSTGSSALARAGKVGFNGGPWDGTDVDGLFARTLLQHALAFFCVNADGRYEHYVAVDDCPEHELCYEHAGPCNERKPHEEHQAGL